MTLKCHSYNSTRFSCRFGNLLKSTSKYYTLNVMTFLVWKILNSRPKVPFINYSSGNYGKLLEKYWHYPLWTNTSWKNGFCLKYFNISFNISGKQYTSRLYLLINCFFVCFFFFFLFFIRWIKSSVPRLSWKKIQIQIQNLPVHDGVSVKFLFCLHELGAWRCHIRHLICHIDIANLVFLIPIMDFQLKLIIR